MTSSKQSESKVENRYMSLGLSLGLVLGAALGTVIWLTTDTFVFFPVFTGAGMTLGLSIGTSVDQRQKDENG